MEIMIELLLHDNVYHIFQTIRCTFTVSYGWKANEIFFPQILPSNMLACLVVVWSGRYDS
jgi:hypothetical protein